MLRIYQPRIRTPFSNISHLLLDLLERRVVGVPADDGQTHVLGELQEVLAGHRLARHRQVNQLELIAANDLFVFKITIESAYKRFYI